MTEAATITAAELAEAIAPARKPLEPFGPNYPALAASAKWRRRQNLTDADRATYGREVLAQIRTLQARELARAAPPQSAAKCASGTWESDGAKILAAHRRAIGGGEFWTDTKSAPKPARISAPAIEAPAPAPARAEAAPEALEAPAMVQTPEMTPEAPEVSPAQPEAAPRAIRPRKVRAIRTAAPEWRPFQPARPAPAFIPAGRATRYGAAHGLR